MRKGFSKNIPFLNDLKLAAGTLAATMLPLLAMAKVEEYRTQTANAQANARDSKQAELAMAEALGQRVQNGDQRPTFFRRTSKEQVETRAKAVEKKPTL